MAYLDNAATSLTPIQVIDAMGEYYTHYGVSIHRGVYALSEEMTVRYEQARENIARFIGAVGQDGASDGHIIFTSGATHASNIIAHGWGMNNIEKGDEIVISDMEHHAVVVPWQQVARQKGAVLKYLPIGTDLTLSLQDEHSRDIIGEKTRIVIITGMSNVTGYVPPLRTIIAQAHRVGAVVAVDAAQLVVHHSIDVAELGCDFLFFSGHKMAGPTGIGVLYGRTDVLAQTDPLLFGGDMIRKVTHEHTTLGEIPARFEGGTPHIEGVVGLSAAVDYVEAIGMENIMHHGEMLGKYAWECAQDIPWLTCYLPASTPSNGTESTIPKSTIFSFNVEGVHAHDVGSILDDEGVAIRAGHHCAQPFMQKLGIAGTARASFYFYNTKDEIDRMFEGLHRVHAIFNR